MEVYDEVGRSRSGEADRGRSHETAARSSHRDWTLRLSDLDNGNNYSGTNMVFDHPADEMYALHAHVTVM